jgi:hypothetical protein
MANVLRYWKDWLLTYPVASRNKPVFRDIESFCLFIGHGRSGHTAFGSVLNAHPEMVLAHELDALSYVRPGITREQLFTLILQRDQWFSRKSFHWHGYDYTVPRQWQGRFTTLRVVGDRKAGLTTLRLREQPDLLNRIRQLVNVPVRILHLLRNPFDIMSSLVRQTGRALDESVVKRHFEMTETNARLVETCSESELLTIRQEDILANPFESVTRTLRFIGLDTSEDYLRDATSILYEEPSKSRNRIPWPEPLIEQTQAQIDRFPFLKGYSFAS